MTGDAKVTLETVECSLCGDDRFCPVYRACPDRLQWLPGYFDVVRCRRCGLVRTSPRPTRESIGFYYPESYGHFAPDESRRSALYAALRWVVRLPYRLRYGHADAADRPSAGANRLLDLGCGAGLLLADMARLGWDPWGLEPNPEMAQRTVERLGVSRDRVFAGTAEEADYPAESFDLVTMSHVVEHLHDPRGVLAKVHRWLRPGGRIRIWIPNFGSLESRVFRRLWHGLDVPRHLHHFSPATLRRMLEASGFAVERVVPQVQGNMLTGSVAYLVDALLRRRRPYRESRALHYALLPAASVLLALGQGGAMDVAATRR